METFINQINEKKLPKQVTEMLMAEAEKKNINGVWLYRPEQQECSLLTIYCKDKLLLQRTFDYLFTGDAFEQDRVLISILDDADLKQHQEDRYLFFRRYARKEDQIYGEEKNYGRFAVIDFELKSLRERYQREDVMLIKYAEELVGGDTPGATVLYLKSIQHDIEFLEYLRLGRSFEGLPFTERLFQLEQFLPAVQQFFVRSENDEQYFLFNAIEEESDVDYMEQYQDAVKKIKTKMRRFVLKQMQALPPNNTQRSIPKSNRLLKKKKIKKALHPLLQLNCVEEIFKFHEISSFGNDSPYQHYYILMIVSEGHAEELEFALQKISETAPSDLKFTIVFHTRFWIQNNTYNYQEFFKSVLQSDNKIHTNGFHPEIHWYTDHTTYYNDLSYYKSCTQNIYKKHLKTSAKNNKSEMVPLIPHFLYHYFGQVIRNRLYQSIAYLPQTDDLQTLWDLLIYSNESDMDYRLAISHFSFNLIGYLHEYRDQKLPALYLNQKEKKELFELLKEIKKME